MSDLISRQDAIDALDGLCDIVCEYSKKQRSAMCGACYLGLAFDVVEELRPARVIRCKDCKHFEYNHTYTIQGVPVLGHEVCNAWGNGCKTEVNGYCFLAERKTELEENKDN
jgi:hypothetical protein